VIAILDYRAGNLTSVQRALEHLGVASEITADPERVRRAERVIFPGVGAAGATMQALAETGLGEVLTEVFKRGNPILGICIGCHVVMDSSEEDGAQCLGFIPGRVRAFPTNLTDGQGGRLKVPHMGWNEVHPLKKHHILQTLPKAAEFYFVHSYYPQPDESDVIYGQTDYGSFSFPSIIGRDNLMAVQFHAEKSGAVGLEILHNFSTWRP